MSADVKRNLVLSYLFLIFAAANFSLGKYSYYFLYINGFFFFFVFYIF